MITTLPTEVWLFPLPGEGDPRRASDEEIREGGPGDGTNVATITIEDDDVYSVKTEGWMDVLEMRMSAASILHVVEVFDKLIDITAKYQS